MQAFRLRAEMLDPFVIEREPEHNCITLSFDGGTCPERDHFGELHLMREGEGLADLWEIEFL